MNAVESLQYFIPELVLLGGAFATLTMDFFVKQKKLVGEFALLVIVLALCLVKAPAQPLSLFFGMFELDAFAHFFRYLALGAVGITILVSLGYAPIKNRYDGEFYGLFLFMAFALILVAAAKNLLMIFLAIEFVSLLSYLLVGFLKNDPKSKKRPSSISFSEASAQGSCFTACRFSMARRVRSNFRLSETPWSPPRLNP
jgi:NADH:ubiquinone oxidoreductase subunit 2 (subunit N)